MTVFCSKWFLQALGHEGLNNLLVAYEDKSAQAVCTFAYCAGPGHEPLIFEGRVTVGQEGFFPTIDLAEAGAGEDRTRSRSHYLRYVSFPTMSFLVVRARVWLTALGWDPIFEYEGETYAEMDKAMKNTLSHRAIALSKLKQWLQTQS